MYTVRSRTQDKWLRFQFNIPDQTLAGRFPVSTCYRAIPAGIPSPCPKPLQPLSFLSLPPVSDSYITSAILATVSVTFSFSFPGTLFAPPFSSFLIGPNHGLVQFNCGVPHIYNRPLQYTLKSIMSSFFFTHIHMSWSSHSTGNVEWQITWIMRKYGSSSIIHNR